MSEKIPLPKLTECVYCEAPTLLSTGRCSACFRVEHFVQSNIALVLQVLDRLGIERLEWVPGPPVEDGPCLVRFTDGSMLTGDNREEWEGDAKDWGIEIKEHTRLKPPAGQ